MLKKLDKISYWITMGATINFAVMVILTAIFKAVVNVWQVGSNLLTISTNLSIYSFFMIGVAIYISTKINNVLKEVREKSKIKNGELEKAS